MNDILVEKPKPSETAQIATVLSHAFLTQPNNVAIFHRQDEYARSRIEWIFTFVKLARPYANILVARKDAQIVGALNMAQSPRCQLSPFETLAVMPQMLMRLSGALLRALQLQSVWAKHDPRDLHWHIGPLGVLPEWQGKGIGSHLLNKALEMIDQKNEAAYLETDRAINLPFYRRAGFVVVGEEKILGVTNWFLWRCPRK